MREKRLQGLNKHRSSTIKWVQYNQVFSPLIFLLISLFERLKVLKLLNNEKNFFYATIIICVASAIIYGAMLINLLKGLNNKDWSRKWGQHWQPI